MDLNLYHVFVQVYESDTLTLAAQRLHVSQSAVSHALGRLREAMGDELFVKDGRRLSPTPFARRIYPQIQQGLTLLSQSKQLALTDPSTQIRRITVAMNDEIELLLLPVLMQKLQHTLPHVLINSVRLERRDMEKRLKFGQMDVAIDVARVVPEQINQMPLFHNEFVVLSNVIHERLDEKSYLNATHVTVSSRPTGQSIEDVMLAQLGHGRRIAIRCQHYVSAVRVLQESPQPLLLTLPQQLAQALPTDGLITFASPLKLSPLSLHLYWHQDMQDDVVNAWIRKQVVKSS